MKLVYLYSTIKMMDGPIKLRFTYDLLLLDSTSASVVTSQAKLCV